MRFEDVRAAPHTKGAVMSPGPKPKDSYGKGTAAEKDVKADTRQKQGMGRKAVRVQREEKCTSLSWGCN